MKNLVLLINCLAIASGLQAQELISNGGQTQELTGLHWTFSVGEAVVGDQSVSSGNQMLNWYQGFQHPLSPGSFLPLRWLSFEGEVLREDLHQLRWKVEHDGLNVFFTIERSVDGNAFQPLARQPGNGQVGQTAIYSYNDQLVQPGRWYYRIRQTDFDGYSSFSPIIGLGQPAANFDLLVFPNPAQSMLYFNIVGGLEIQSPPNEPVTIEIWNMQAQLVKMVPYQQELDISDLPNGAYLVVMPVATGAIRKIVVKGD